MKHLNPYFLLCAALITGTISSAHATDYTPSDNDSNVVAASNDSVTVSTFFGPDNNTDDDKIFFAGDNISVSITGTLQGHDDLLKSSGDADNLSITISATGEVIANGTRAIDIDGGSRTISNMTFINNGEIYSAERNALSAQDTIDSTITNNTGALISGSDRTMLLNNSDNLTVTNAGTIVANNDNITYRNGTLTQTRTSSGDGYAIAGSSTTGLTLTNSGTISANGQRVVHLHSSDDATLSNSGTITGTSTQVIQLEQADRTTMTNSGTISGATNVIYADELEDSTITNDATGTITASGDVAVYLQYADNATLVNSGTIKSDNGSVVDARNAINATITNQGLIKTTTTAAHYILQADNTTITNSSAGNLISTANGLNLVTGNDVKNYGTLSVADNGTAINITGNNNTIALYDNSTLSGAITAGSGTTGNILTIDNDLAYSLSDNMSGAIALTKTGTGTLTITQTQGYTGATTVSAGTLTMNGNAANSAVTIAASATLGGSGTTGDIVNNGELKPGNSIGTLNVTGDVTLNSGSNLEIEVNGTGDSDKIILSGAMTAGGTLEIVPEHKRNYKNVVTYDIIDSASVTGTFNTIDLRACGADVSTSYNSDGITVTLTGCYAKRGKAVEQIEDYITSLYDTNPSSDLSAVLTELEGLSGTTYENALGTLDIDAPLAIASATTQNIRAVNNFIANRATAQSGSNSARQKLRMLNASEPLSSDSKISIRKRIEQQSRKGMWVKGFGGDGEKKPIKDLGVNGYDYDFQGTTIGLDLESETIKQGIAVSLQTGSVTSNNKQGYQEYDTVMLNYQNTQFFDSGASLALSAGLAMTTIDAKRYIDVGGIDRTAKSSYKSYALDLGVGYSFSPMRFGNFANDMMLSLAANFNSQERYRETGADSLNLSVDPKHMITARLGLENTLYWQGDKETRRDFLPFISAGIFGQRHLTNTAIKQNFSGANKIKVITDRDQELYGEFGIGFLHIEEDDDELRLQAKTKFSDKVTEYSASLDYGLKF